MLPFYTEILNFKLTDYFTKPFSAYFFHLNPRHHSLAFIGSGKNGIHHLMVELCYLDDVGQGYDIALRKPEMIGTTLGRHVNDHVTSFYSWSPSKFLVEYGWGGRTIEPATWTPEERTEGPSLWGHDRKWLSPEALRTIARPARRCRRRRRPRAAQRHGRQLSARRATSARGGTPTWPPPRRRAKPSSAAIGTARWAAPMAAANSRAGGVPASAAFAAVACASVRRLATHAAGRNHNADPAPLLTDR